MQRNNSLINVAEDRVTKRTKMLMRRASVDCGGKESGGIVTKERGRDGVKEVKTETTGHGARAEKERKKERQSGLDWDLKIWTSNGVYT